MQGLVILSRLYIYVYLIQIYQAGLNWLYIHSIMVYICIHDINILPYSLFQLS